MRGRSVVVGAVALALTGPLALLICFGKRESHPPILSVVRVEPAGVLDDNGLELQMVSLSISAPTNLRSRPAEPLFVRTVAIPVDAKVADRWVRVDGGLWKGCELWPGSPRPHTRSPADSGWSILVPFCPRHGCAGSPHDYQPGYLFISASGIGLAKLVTCQAETGGRSSSRCPFRRSRRGEQMC